MTIVQVRRLGCGQLLGAILVLVGAAILLSYYKVVPEHVTRWWPLVVVAFGVFLLVRHYWMLLDRLRTPSVIDGAYVSRRLPTRRPGLSPPVIPLVVIAVGIFLLLRNFHYVSFGVAVAILLILVGFSVLAGNARSVLERR